jgi:superfamily II DNA or RNA helicase
MRELRDDQADAITALREAVAQDKRRICMQAPTGYGKTLLASALVESARKRNKKVLFTVPMIGLVDQTIEMFAGQKIFDVGVIQAHHHMTDWSRPIQICSVQTLMKRALPKADLVIIDECHKWFKFYERWLSGDKMPEWARVPFIALSATPWLRGLGSWFNHFHKAGTIQGMIDAGHLSPFRVYAPSHPDLSGIKITAGDYNEGELSAKMSEAKLVADAVDTWIALGENRQTLCYAVDRAHAKHLQTQFQAKGIACGYQDAFTKDHERRALKRDFHNGVIKVVCNVGTLTTGIDWDVRCISMCRPTKSDMLFVQIVGRGLRTADGKTDCLILDHSSNHSRLGFVTDIDESYIGLHDGKTPTHENRTDVIALPKECPKCAYMKPPRLALCPMCGFKAEVINTVKAEAGELRELKPKPKEKKHGTREQLNMMDKATLFAELKAYGMRQGYKDAWAANQYRDVTGVWPNHPSIRHVAPASRISDLTMGWIKSRQIAYAKSKENYGKPML